MENRLGNVVLECVWNYGT